MRRNFATICLMVISIVLVEAPASAEDRWTGFHLGMTLGNTWGKGDPQAPSSVQTLKTESFVFGPRVGYDHQIVFGEHSVVIGVLGDVLFGPMSGSVPDGNFIRFGGETDLQASIRARLGIPVFDGQLLPYVTGGLAIARSSASMACPPGAGFGFCAVSGPFRDTQSETMLGYTLGIGIEALVRENVSLFLEYRHSDFGNRTVQFTTPLGDLPPGKSHASTDVVMGGISFRF